MVVFLISSVATRRFFICWRWMSSHYGPNQSKMHFQRTPCFIGQKFQFKTQFSKKKEKKTPIQMKCFHISVISFRRYISSCCPVGHFPLYSLFFEWILNIFREGFYCHNSLAQYTRCNLVLFTVTFSLFIYTYYANKGKKPFFFWNKAHTLCRPMVERDCQQHHYHNCIHIDDNLCYYTEETLPQT